MKVKIEIILPVIVNGESLQTADTGIFERYSLHIPDGMLRLDDIRGNWLPSLFSELPEI